MQSLVDHKTWEVVPLPPERRPWAVSGPSRKSRTKAGEHGAIRYKARLVAHCFAQKYGTDYDEAFAPGARQTTLRSLLTIASRDDMLVQHLDIKRVYLFARLEEIYMPPPLDSDQTTRFAG